MTRVLNEIMHFSKKKTSINLTKLSKFYTYLYGKLASFYKKIFFASIPGEAGWGLPFPLATLRVKKR